MAEFRTSVLDKDRNENSRQLGTRDEALTWMIGELRTFSQNYPDRPGDAEPDSEFLRRLPISNHTRVRDGRLLEWWYVVRSGDDFALILQEVA